MSWFVSTPPELEPVTLAEAKAHLRVDCGDDDALILALVTAARTHIEQVCEHAMMPQQWTMLADCFEGLVLPGGNVRSVTSIAYMPASGADITVAPAQYVVDATRNPARVSLASGASWPIPLAQANVVKAVYQVGYENKGAVPAPLKAAILLMVGNLYANREAQVQGAPLSSNATVDALIWPYRRVLI